MQTSIRLLASSLLIVGGAGYLDAADRTGLEASVLPSFSIPISPAVKPYVKVSATRVALTHLRLIDGTGQTEKDDRTILIDGGKIVAVESSAKADTSGALVVDLTGHTAIPGIVGMHDHLFYVARPNLDTTGHSDPPSVVPPMTFSAIRLYLANGVTTMRTAGSVEPYADINLKRLIDAGDLPGPHIDVTGPYLEGANSPFVEMHQLRDAEDARQTVAFWAAQGATSFKAYMNISRAELKAATDEAHRLGRKVTGHLCSVTYPEAVALGIDNLEHGFFVNTQLDPGKVPDVCPKTGGVPTLMEMDPDSPKAGELIELLVSHHVAITSTLAVFEQSAPRHAPIWTRAMDAMTPQAREAYLYSRNQLDGMPPERARDRLMALQRDMALERKFVRAGGLMMSGADPTGNGGIIPGFADLRCIELLVEAGFTAAEAIEIATLNGATYLGLANRIGSVEPGKDADLVVLKGDPGRVITDVENVELVFKDGVGFDTAALLASVRGRYGEY